MRQVRLRRSESVQERLDGTAAAERPRRAERDAGGTEPVARDAVDEPRVQIVDDGQPVAVEVVGDDRGRRDRGRGQRRLDLRLERGAPEGEELTADLRELREDEALRNGAQRELAHMEERACRVRERLLGLPGGELLDAEEPAAMGLAENAELVVTVRFAVTRERECERVGMPDEFEHGRPS